jgi:hypothetical protein
VLTMSATFPLTGGGDDKYGGCAYDPKLWCCPPGGISPPIVPSEPRSCGKLTAAPDAACWGWGQVCSAGRKECRSGTATWCCDEEYEDCEYEFNKINLCLLKTALFLNPLSGAPTTVDPTMTDTTTTATVEIAATAVVESTGTGTSQSSRVSGRPTVELSTTSATAMPSEGGGGFSTGAAVGAGVGGMLGFLAIVAGVFFLMRRWRRRQSEETGMENAARGTGDPSVGLMSPHGWGPGVISECADTSVHSRHELETKTWNHELQANPMELEGTQMPVEALTSVPSVAETPVPSVAETPVPSVAEVPMRWGGHEQWR